MGKVSCYFINSVQQWTAAERREIWKPTGWRGLRLLNSNQTEGFQGAWQPGQELDRGLPLGGGVRVKFCPGSSAPSLKAGDTAGDGIKQHIPGWHHTSPHRKCSGRGSTEAQVGLDQHIEDRKEASVAAAEWAVRTV